MLHFICGIGCLHWTRIGNNIQAWLLLQSLWKILTQLLWLQRYNSCKRRRRHSKIFNNNKNNSLLCVKCFVVPDLELISLSHYWSRRVVHTEYKAEKCGSSHNTNTNTKTNTNTNSNTTTNMSYKLKQVPLDVVGTYMWSNNSKTYSCLWCRLPSISCKCFSFFSYTRPLRKMCFWCTWYTFILHTDGLINILRPPTSIDRDVVLIEL